MATLHRGTREISCKIVYYGPGLSGKTTNLQVVHQRIPRDKKTEMISLSTEGDRTLFFDFLPLNLGSIQGFKTKFQLYTVPGQVYYNATRKMVLRGVDGVVFVADSQRSRMAENIESLQNLRQNIQENNLKLDNLPLVIQYNKRDLDDVFSVEELNEQLNPDGLPWYAATAHNGKGVISTLKAISMLVIEEFNRNHGVLRKVIKSFSDTAESVNVSAFKPINAPSTSDSEAKKDKKTKTPMAASPFKVPKISKSKPSTGVPRIGSGTGLNPPLNLKMPEEEIELRPYIPKDKDKT